MKMNLKHRVLSIILALVMVLSIAPVAIFAEGATGSVVAEVNGVGYASLADAIKASQSGDTIKLLKDVNLGTSKVSFYNGSVTNLTFDLGGHKITSAVAGNGTVIASKAGLVIKNGTIENTSTGTKTATSAIYVTGGGSTTLENVTLVSNKSGLYVCNSITNTASVTVDIGEGTVTNGTESGVYIEKQTKGSGTKLPQITLNINGGTINGTKDGVKVASNSSPSTVKTNITGGTVSSVNIISLSSTYPATLEISGGTVEGTLTCNGPSEITVKDGIFNGEVKMLGTNGTISISGGTFKNEVSKDYLASGFTLEKNADGTYGVKPEVSYVASVNGTKYKTFAEALAAAKDNDTITLLDDVTVDTISINKAITLDLNGKTLTGTAYRTIELTSTGDLTVQDSIGGGKIANNYSGSAYPRTVYLNGAGAVLTLESGTIESTPNKTSLQSVAIDSEKDKACTVNIKGGSVVVPEAATQGRSIVASTRSMTLNISGGTITGGLHGVDAYSGSTVNITGGTITARVVDTGAVEEAFGMRIIGTADVTIDGGEITGVKMDDNGYNLDVPNVTLKSGTVNGSFYSITNGTIVFTVDANATIKLANDSAQKFLPSTVELVQNADGTYGVKSAKVYYAAIGETKYDTLADAIAAAKDGDTITLLANCEAERVNLEDKSLKVVLNGYTLESTSDYGVMFCAKNGNTITIDGTVEGSKLVGTLMVTNGTDGHIAISGGTYENSKYCPIYINGAVSTDNSTLTVKGATIIANGTDSDQDAGCAVYLAGYCTSSFTDTTITAPVTGIEIRAGKLTLKNCTVAGGSGEVTTSANGNGTTVTNAALAISQHNTKKPIDVTITSGEYTATAALFQTDVQGTGSVGVNATVASGTFNGTVSAETNNTVAVKGGKFTSEVPENCCAVGYIPQDNGNGIYGVKEGTYVAEYNGTKYESLQEAIDAASHRNGGQTEVTLLCNVTIKETVTFAKEFSAGSVLLNLGGYTLTGEGCRALQINRGNLYLENGTVTSTGIVDSSSVIRIGSNEATYNGATPMLYMQKDAKVVAPESYGVTIFGSATRGEKLKVMSNAEIIATGPSPAISGNGGASYNTDDRTTTAWKAEEIIIGENAVISAANNYAIYHPECGTLNIQGGTITGTGGIQMCSGTLKISNSPKITANGSADYDYTGDAGVVYDAAAISVINRGYPQGPATVTIKGTPTVTAANGEVIHAFTWSNSNKTDGEWAEAGDYINVSGGTYNKQFNEAFLTADSSLVANTEGGYTVDLKKVAEFNGTQYTSLALAVRAANETGGTVKLLDNVTLTSNLGIGGAAKVTLNLNKKTLTLDGAQIYTQGSAAVTIQNGTIKRTDEPTSGDASNFAIQVMNGSVLALGGSMSTTKVMLESTYGIYNVGATLNVRYANITTDGWSIAVSDSASKTGTVTIGVVGTANITSQSGNCIGTAVNTKSNVLIHNGTLTSNGTAWDAGVVYWASEGTLTIEGGTFTASTAEGSTAAAVYQKNGTVKISGAATKLLGNNALVVKAGDGSTGELVTELSAGTYSTKPDESWVVDGKEIHETDDGLYKVEGPYVVEVTLEDGTVRGFDSWSKAFYSTAAQEHNATVKLLTNIETTSTVTTWATVTVDFNGYTLTVNGSGVAAITVLTKGTAGNVTLKDSVGGGGIVTTGVYGVTVRGTGATATVESGSYNCATSVVQVENGTAYIKGGTFKTEDADKIYLLNCIDKAFAAKTAVIEVTGGTFHGFDPSANPEGEGTTYVKPGYVSNDNGDGSYTVSEYKPIEVWTGYTGTKVASYKTIAEAAANLGENKWIIVAKDYTLTDNFSFTDGIYLDVVNGANLTVAEGVTITVQAGAKRLGVREGAALVNNGTIVVCGSSNINGFAMLYGTFSGNELTVPEGCFLDNNGSNYFATANADALYEITFGDGTVKKTADSTNIKGGNVTQIKLLGNVTKGGWTIDNASVGPETVLDLNGYTISYSGANPYYATLNIYTKVIIKNGTIKYEGSKRGAIDLVGQGDLTIGADVVIDGGASYGIFTSGTSKLTVNGTVKANGFYAISGNGSKDNGGNVDNCDITVNDGAVISAPNGIAIYHPELGTVTVNGGTISGHTGIELCAGKLVVKGGSVTSTGDNWDATGSQSAILDGAAISIINRNYPGGTPTAEIRGGTFKATGNGAQTIKAYDYTGNTVAEWTNVSDSVKVFGGTFSSIPANMEALCADNFKPVQNGDGTYSVKEANITITVSGVPSNAGVLNGGGKYAKGDTVTVVAAAVTGYDFIGWYKEDGTTVSTDATYTFEATESINLVAKFTSKEKKQLDIAVGKGSVTAGYDGKSENWDLPHVDSYARGTYFTLTAVPMTGYKFLFWTNGDNRVVSDDATYSFYLGDDTKLTAWFISETPDASKYYVTFRDKNNEIILARNAAADGKIEVPTLSDYDGFTFKGWFDENGNPYTVVDGKITVEGDVTVYAKYEAKTGLKVIENGVQHENTYSYGDLVKVTAEATKEVDGETKYFSGWYANRVLVSYKTTYSFYVTGDVTIEAKYEGTEELQQKIILNMSGIRSGDETSQKLVMNVTWSLPSDCELVEAGIVRTMFSNFASYLTIEKADGTYVKRNISVLKMSAGTYIYTLTLRNAITVKEPVLARGYIIYRDAGGNLQTAYTDVNTFEFATSATTAE